MYKYVYSMSTIGLQYVLSMHGGHPDDLIQYISGAEKLHAKTS